ncbi:MAG: hypothetical protein VW239_11175 [Candidatus Nanopelagicales bacterium]|jgi:hypothetical protein
MTMPSHESLQQGLPISVPVEPTGDARVDAALERLLELDESPVSEHVEVYADIHTRLTAALGDRGTEDAS